MPLLKLILSVLSVLVILQTGLSFIRTRVWWVRIFDFPRAQIACCSAVLLVGLGLTNLGFTSATTAERLLFLLLATAVVVQVAQMLPYTRLWKKQVPSAPPNHPRDRRLRLVISNVCMKNRDSDRWLATLRAEDPDVIVAVEPDTWWDDALAVLQADYPHHVRQPQDNTYGIIVYSRLPLHGTRIKHLVEADVPSVFTTIELPSGDRIRCVLLHPRPPRPDIQQDSHLRDAELVRAGRIVQSFSSPVVVAGDLNDVAWSHTTHLFQRLARLLDPRIGRGRFSTFHADHRILRYPLDHVFHSNHFDLVTLRRLGHVGSDHFPMMIELALRQDRHDRPVPEPLDEDDEEEAIDAIEDVREFHEQESPQERRERQLADS